MRGEVVGMQYMPTFALHHLSFSFSTDEDNLGNVIFNTLNLVCLHFCFSFD